MGNGNSVVLCKLFIANGLRRQRGVRCGCHGCFHEAVALDGLHARCHCRPQFHVQSAGRLEVALDPARGRRGSSDRQLQTRLQGESRPICSRIAIRSMFTGTIPGGRRLRRRRTHDGPTAAQATTVALLASLRGAAQLDEPLRHDVNIAAPAPDPTSDMAPIKDSRSPKMNPHFGHSQIIEAAWRRFQPLRRSSPRGRPRTRYSAIAAIAPLTSGDPPPARSHSVRSSPSTH